MATFERLSDGVQRGVRLTIVVDGAPMQAFDGESVATALLAADRLALRWTDRRGAPRGAFCAMGVCFDCLVTIDGISQQRSCMTSVREGMVIETRVARSDISSAGARALSEVVTPPEEVVEGQTDRIASSGHEGGVPTRGSL